MTYLLLTVDYEIFGNGTGDVRRHMVEPTESMARICEKHGAPLTVFFEAEEYLAFCQYARQLEQLLGYDPARLIRDQVRSLAKRGHDFQLHLHPQWHGARLLNGKWLLRPEMETVDHLFEGAEETSGFIRERKALLEELVGNAASVLAYRAGAFSASPGEKLLSALAQNGFQFDSSVVRGLFRQAGDYCLDYRGIRTDKRLWRVRDEVTREDPDGAIWEIPIHSVPVRRYEQITWSRLRAKFSRNVPAAQQKEMVHRFVQPTHPLKTVRTLFEPVPLKLDFHNQTADEFCQTLATAAPRDDRDAPDVMVAIGHSKEHVDDAGFNRLLGEVMSRGEAKITTFAKISDLLPPAPTLKEAALT
jgi:hypothetical protein